MSKDPNDLAREGGPSAVREALDNASSMPSFEDLDPGPSEHAAAAAAPSLNLTPWEYKDPSKLPRRQWLYSKLLCRGIMSLTIAPGGVGKSALTLTEAVALASGRPLLEQPLPRGAKRVLYFNLEDPAVELDRRTAGICSHYRVGPDDLGGRLFIRSGVGLGFCTGGPVEGGRIFAVDESVFRALEDDIQENKIDVVILDPFVSSHACPENDNTIMDKLAKRWAALAMNCDVAVHIVHHTRKQGNNKHEMDADSARGAGAVVAAARRVRALHGMTNDQADIAGIERHSRFAFFWEGSEKQNLARAHRSEIWYEMQSVSLENGSIAAREPADTVGVPRRWQFTAPEDAIITIDQIKTCQDLIAAGDYRENSQAAGWAGHVIGPVFGQSSTNKLGRRQITRIIKRLVATGALIIEREPDPRAGKDRTRPMLRVGKRKPTDEDQETDDSPHPEE